MLSNIHNETHDHNQVQKRWCLSTTPNILHKAFTHTHTIPYAFKKSEEKVKGIIFLSDSL